METAELLRKVRRIDIKTRGMSSDLFAGEYHSAFKGRGMSFSEVREYQFGDDIRAIDWNVTARLNHPYVKVFEEERELTVMLLLDLSPSAFFGSTGQFKNELIAELSAVLAFAAINNNDKVGCLLFSDRVEKFIPPKKGKSHMLLILREILGYEGQGSGTDIAGALRYVNGLVKKRSIAFLISDFMDEGYETPLRILARRHDLVGVHLHDARERELPRMGMLRVRDPERGTEQWVDTHDKRVREQYTAQYDQRYQQFYRMFRQVGCDTLTVDCSLADDRLRERRYLQSLHQFFRRRDARRRGR
jgi:uncharacterized protein (DUF58 family)